MTPVYDSDLNDAGRRNGHARPKGKIPYPPGRDASFSELREWLSEAIGLPKEVRVETVTRAGRDGEDPLTISLSNEMKMRSSHQKRLQQGRTLQAFLASESDGIAQPAYLSPAEVGDVYTVLCRLGTASAKVDPIGDMLERLAMFVALCDEIIGSLDHEGRYVTLEALKSRPAFNRNAALAMSSGMPEAKPTMLVDQADKHRYIRALEWVAYLRFALGHTVDPSRLVAQMAELGAERIDPQAWNSDRSHKSHLVLFRLPENL